MCWFSSAAFRPLELLHQQTQWSCIVQCLLSMAMEPGIIDAIWLHDSIIWTVPSSTDRTSWCQLPLCSVACLCSTRVVQAAQLHHRPRQSCLVLSDTCPLGLHGFLLTATAPAKAAITSSPAADTIGTADQDRLRAVSPVKDTAAAGPEESPFRSTTQYYDPTDDEEMGLPIDGSNQGGNATTVPSQRSQLLMRRLTTMMKPMVMEWQDIGCSYNTSAGMKTVLKNVWGRADPGDMLALMGPSGAGKSTLMDILAGRKSVGNLTGAVLVNSRPRKKAEFARKTAYVPQVYTPVCVYLVQ
eukprot:GHUV01022209.1.p1 GENE.GHUV01022209.1~~GHUV01022209.1.p1  ORF type:complete len:299 (-),score=59.91 GHUV01022209.1:26-922(-)